MALHLKDGKNITDLNKAWRDKVLNKFYIKPRNEQEREKFIKSFEMDDKSHGLDGIDKHDKTVQITKIKSLHMISRDCSKDRLYLRLDEHSGS